MDGTAPGCQQQHCSDGSTAMGSFCLPIGLVAAWCIRCRRMHAATGAGRHWPVQQLVRPFSRLGNLMSKPRGSRQLVAIRRVACASWLLPMSTPAARLLATPLPFSPCFQHMCPNTHTASVPPCTLCKHQLSVAKTPRVLATPAVPAPHDPPREHCQCAGERDACWIVAKP